MPEESTQKQVDRARSLARFFMAEDVKGTGPAGVREVDQDPARGRVSINNLDTVSAMLRSNDGQLVQEFGHARVSGRLEYDVATGSVLRLDASVSGLEGQGTLHFTIARREDGVRYSWSTDEQCTPKVVVERNGTLVPLAEDSLSLV